MRPAALLVLAALASCAAPPPAGPADASVPPADCGAASCEEGEQCLERASLPGVPACVAPGACDARPPGADLFGDALQALGRTRCTATLPEGFLDGAAPPSVAKDPLHRLPHFGPLHAHPLALPAWSDALALSFKPDAGGRVSAAIAAAAAGLGLPVDQRTPARRRPESLAVAVAQFAAEAGASRDVEVLAADAADVPADVQEAAALLVEALREALVVRREVFAAVDDLATFQRCAPSLLLPTAGCAAFTLGDPAVKALFDGAIALGPLYQAAFDLATAVESAGLESLAGQRGFSFDQPTAAGRIVIADAGAQVFEANKGPVALLLDLGGDDTYRIPAGATAGPQQGVALHIDLGGNDTYAYPEVTARGDGGRLPSDGEGRNPAGDAAEGRTPISLSSVERQGAAVAGIGLLFELGGDDSYVSLRESQGFAAFGVGVLYDRAGADRYVAEAGAQGSALYGIGLLVDDEGDDERRLYANGQGFGYALGFGALVDGAGHDVYWADPGDPERGGDPLYFSPQLSGRGNSSFVQGAGFGRRDDTAAAPLSGGIGLCADFGGESDDYTASVFGQGTGYYFGTGVLFDEGGDDLYDGLWYVRGADAHFALASFHDVAGNDRHNTRLAGAATSLGVGHDHSIGWFLDDAGDDVYLAPGLSLGSANACGWSYFVDRQGDDRYEAPGTSFGTFNDTKNCSYALQPTLGLLVDGGGRDTYLLAGAALERENAVTEATPQPDAPGARGVQVDGEGALLVLP